MTTTIKVAGATYDLTELDAAELDSLLDLFITNAARYTERYETASGIVRKAAIQKAIAEYDAGKTAVETILAGSKTMRLYDAIVNSEQVSDNAETWDTANYISAFEEVDPDWLDQEVELVGDKVYLHDSDGYQETQALLTVLAASN